MIIIDGPSGNGIGKSIASILNLELLECKRKIFADGESEVEVNGMVKDKEVTIVQSTYPMQDKNLQELFFLANDLGERGARNIHAVIPYLAYARQNKKYEGKNNAISIHAILKMLNAVGVTTLITVAPHNVESLSAFKGKVMVADAITPLANELKRSTTNPFVLAPDKGALKIAERFATVIGCDHASIGKKRDTITGEIRVLDAPEGDLRGKEVIIVDDMISTGATTAQAARFAYDHGASRVIASAVHLLMVEGAYERLKDAGVREIYGTNTIMYDKAHVVNIAEAIAKVIAV
jgi:ribose-phosphate pyrophosphokinase